MAFGSLWLPVVFVPCSLKIVPRRFELFGLGEVGLGMRAPSPGPTSGSGSVAFRKGFGLADADVSDLLPGPVSK